MRARSFALALSAVCAGVWLAGPASAQTFRDEVEVREGGRLEVELDQGSVELETHGEETVSVEASSFGFGNQMRFRLTSDGRDAHLVGKREHWFGFGAGRSRVRIHVPERYSVGIDTSGGSVEVEDLIGDVAVRSSGGSIEVDNVRGYVSLHTSGGRISVAEVDGDVRVFTSGGPIRISEVSGDVEAETSGGPIDAHDIGGHVRAKTSGGRVSARFEGEPAGELETSGGAIEVELPERARLDLRAHTSGGRVHIDDDLRVEGDVRRGDVDVEINGGGHSLRLETSGGNIRIRAR